MKKKKLKKILAELLSEHEFNSAELAQTMVSVHKSPKEEANEAGEPWVNVLGVSVDPTTLDAGSFELDWNDIFVARLIKAGYKGKTDADIVDQWFQNICRNIVMETWEQEDAQESAGRRVSARRIDDEKTEIG